MLLHIIVDISSLQMNEFWWNRRVISLLRQYLLIFTLIQKQKTTTTTTSTVKFIQTAAGAAASIVTDTEKYKKEANLKSKPNKRISMPGRCKDFSLAITPRHFLQPNQNTRV